MTDAEKIGQLKEALRELVGDMERRLKAELDAHIRYVLDEHMTREIRSEIHAIVRKAVEASVTCNVSLTMPRVERARVTRADEEAVESIMNEFHALRAKWKLGEIPGAGPWDRSVIVIDRKRFEHYMNYIHARHGYAVRFEELVECHPDHLSLKSRPLIWAENVTGMRLEWLQSPLIPG